MMDVGVEVMNVRCDDGEDNVRDRMGGEARRPANTVAGNMTAASTNVANALRTPRRTMMMMGEDVQCVCASRSV